jgi:hypothetical protein
MAEVANFTQQLISLAQTIHIKNNRFFDCEYWRGFTKK